MVSDPAGTQGKVSHIVGACALVSIFIMGGFALLADEERKPTEHGQSEGSTTGAILTFCGL